MTTYRLIGKGTTDSNGVAHMTKATSDGGSTWTDTTGYTGVGAGEIDLLASTDNPITSSSCQSAPYPVIDAFVKDNCTTDTSVWGGSTVSIDRTSGEYMQVTGNGSSNALLFVKNQVNDVFDYTQSYAFEFKGLNANASSIYIYVGSSSKGGISNPISSDFVDIRLEYNATNQKIKLFKDGVQQGSDTPLTAFTSNFSIRFVDWNGDMSFKMKDFRAYPI